MLGSAHQRPAAVALAFGETVKLQNHVEVIRQLRDLDALAQAGQAQCDYRLTQLGRAGDVNVPRVERDADLKPLVNVALRAENRCHGLVVPDVRPDMDR
jgi:hypothetical protein